MAAPSAGTAGTPGILLWAASDPAGSRETVEDAARDFGLATRSCTLDELMGQVRGSSVDVVLVELDADTARGIALARELHERLPRVAILVASPDPDVSTMRGVLEAGATDFLSRPIDRNELHKALIRFTQARGRSAAAPSVAGEVIVVAGARGGLGVTTVAVNLAVRIAALTRSEVGLIDLDLQRGDVATFLNLAPVHSVTAIAGAHGEVDEIFLHGTLVRHPSGVSVLAAPKEIEEADTIGHGDVNTTLRLLRSQFRWVLVDTPRTITGPTLAAFEQADRILLLSDLSVPGVRSAQRTSELFGRLGIPRERVELVVTQAVPGPVDLKDAVRAIGREPLVVIPRDEAAGKAMNAGVPLNGGRPAGLPLAMEELATRLTGVVAARKSSAGLLGRLFSKERA